MTNRTRETWFPLSHYHGITIAVDIPVADRVLRQVSEALGGERGCTMTSLLCWDRLCACDSCFIMRALSPSSTSSPSFTMRRRICGQVISNSKVMELFLFLSSPEITAHGEETPVCRPGPGRTNQISPAVSGRAPGSPITLQALSQTFFLSPLTSWKKVLHKGKFMEPPSMPICSQPTASHSSGASAGDRNWM